MTDSQWAEISERAQGEDYLLVLRAWSDSMEEGGREGMARWLRWLANNRYRPWDGLTPYGHPWGWVACNYHPQTITHWLSREVFKRVHGQTPDGLCGKYFSTFTEAILGAVDGFLALDRESSPC